MKALFFKVTYLDMPICVIFFNLIRNEYYIYADSFLIFDNPKPQTESNKLLNLDSH